MCYRTVYFFRWCSMEYLSRFLGRWLGASDGAVIGWSDCLKWLITNRLMGILWSVKANDNGRSCLSPTHGSLMLSTQQTLYLAEMVTSQNGTLWRCMVPCFISLAALLECKRGICIQTSRQRLLHKWIVWPLRQWVSKEWINSIIKYWITTYHTNNLWNFTSNLVITF